MALPEAGPLVGQGREPWASMMEATSAAKAWLTRPDNTHEMDDQFYIWVSVSSLSLIYMPTNL